MHEQWVLYGPDLELGLVVVHFPRFSLACAARAYLDREQAARGTQVVLSTDGMVAARDFVNVANSVLART